MADKSNRVSRTGLNISKTSKNITKTYMIPYDITEALELYKYKHRQEKLSLSDIVVRALEKELAAEIEEVRSGKGD